MNKEQISQQYQSSTIYLDEFIKEFSSWSIALQYMEKQKELTLEQKKDILNYNNEQSLYEKFLQTQTDLEKTFEIATKNELLTERRVQQWKAKLNRAILMFHACNLISSSLAKIVKISLSEQYSYSEIKIKGKNIKIKNDTNSYIPFEERAYAYLVIGEGASSSDSYDDEDEGEKD